MSPEPQNPRPRPGPARSGTAPASEAARISSSDLLAGHGELIILHQGREYRLRITQNGKLLLTA